MRALMGVALAACLIGTAGCAGTGSVLGELREHPEHCEVAIAYVRAAVAAGVLPPGTTPAEAEVMLHRTQAALFAAGLCPSP